MVVRAEIRDEVREHLRSHLGPGAPLRWVLQPEPLGTAHALLLAARELGGPDALALANGDDLYGPEAMTLLARATRRLASHTPQSPPRAALVGYAMADTLSDEGGVSRGWVETGAPSGRSEAIPVVRVREFLEVKRASKAMVGRPVTSAGEVGEWLELPADAVASMNLWALNGAALGLVEERFRRWRDRRLPTDAEDGVDAADRAAEFSLAPVLNAALEAGELSLTLEGLGRGWTGLTFPGDLAEVRSHMARLHARGRYPEPLARALVAPEDGGRGSS